MVAAAVATLLVLRQRLRAQEDAAVLSVVRLFDRTGALGRAESRSLRFSSVESLAAAVQPSEFIARIVVAKRLPGGGEAIVVPFDLELREPRWRDSVAWRRVDVGQPVAGALYLAMDRRSIRTVDATIGAFCVLFISGLAILLRRQREKEVQLQRTVSELEERRAEVIRLERLALAGQLSANIFHDIRKPVLNIRHEVDDALESGTAPDAELLRSVRRQTELFTSILRELGLEEFVRGTANTPEWCDLRELAERSLRLVRYERRNVDTTLDADEPLPLLFAEPHRLIQLLSNLVLNAFQAMNGEGHLRLSISSAPSRLLIRVEDSGPGIPEAMRARLFEPFHTTRAEAGGSGLGLYICRTIVDDLNGTIRVERSDALGGAMIVIELPVPEGGEPSRDV